MIDVHCHLDLYPDPQAVIAECVRRRLYVLSVTTVPSAFNGTAALAPKNSRIRTALGLHPELAATRASELPIFECLLSRTRYVGEVGLDGTRDHRGTLETQRGVLADMLRLCARAGGKIISVHSRGASRLILDELAVEPAAGTAILHWYVGTPKQVARAASMDCWFSVGPAMLSSVRGRASVLAMPRERVLPESDGPFGQFRSHPVKPWDAWTVTAMLADLWREDESNVAAMLIANFDAVVHTQSAS